MPQVRGQDETSNSSKESSGEQTSESGITEEVASLDDSGTTNSG